MNLKLKVRLKNIRDLYRGSNNFKKGYQPRTAIVKDEKGDLVTDSYSILATWRKHFTQLFHVHGVSDVRQTEIQGGAEPTDTFRIGILRRRDSLSWLAARGTVEERTPFHTVRNSMAVREMFGTVISRFGDITWPARSPDLTVPDFFFRVC